MGLVRNKKNAVVTSPKIVAPPIESSEVNNVNNSIASAKPVTASENAIKNSVKPDAVEDSVEDKVELLDAEKNSVEPDHVKNSVEIDDVKDSVEDKVEPPDAVKDFVSPDDLKDSVSPDAVKDSVEDKVEVLDAVKNSVEPDHVKNSVEIDDVNDSVEKKVESPDAVEDSVSPDAVKDFVSPDDLKDSVSPDAVKDSVEIKYFEFFVKDQVEDNSQPKMTRKKVQMNIKKGDIVNDNEKTSEDDNISKDDKNVVEMEDQVGGTASGDTKAVVELSEKCKSETSHVQEAANDGILGVDIGEKKVQISVPSCDVAGEVLDCEDKKRKAEDEIDEATNKKNK